MIIKIIAHNCFIKCKLVTSLKNLRHAVFSNSVMEKYWAHILFYILLEHEVKELG